MTSLFRSSAIWQVLEKAIRLPTSLLVSILVANYLGAEQFGFLTAAHTIVLIAIPFASLGIDGIVYKQISNKAPTSSTVSNAIALKVFGFLGAYALVALYAFLFAEAQVYMVLTLGLILLFVAFNPIDILMIVKGYGRTKTLIALFVFLISSAFRLGLIWIDAPLFYFALAYVLEAFLLMVVLVIWARRNGIRISPRLVKTAPMWEATRSAFPLFLSNAMISIFARVDILMIAHYAGNAPVGWYAVAVNLAALVAIIPATLNGALFPLAVAAKEASKEAYFASMLRILSLSYLVGLSFAILLIVLGPWFIATFYDAEFSPSADVLPLLVWAGVLQFFGSFSTLWLTNEGLQRHRLYRISIAMMMNVVLNMFWIPAYGIEGAAWATLVSYLFASILGNALTGSTRPIFWLQLRALAFVGVARMIQRRFR